VYREGERNLDCNDCNDWLRIKGEGGEALGLAADGEYEEGEPAAVDSIMEPSEEVREADDLEVGMPGRSWRCRAEPLAAREGEEAAAEALAAEDNTGDFFAGCCTGEEAPIGLVRGESTKAAAAPPALGLVEDDLP
jgi:hypothetical protein